MNERVISISDVIGRIIAGLSPPNFTSLLIEEPPGCAHPGFIRLLEEKYVEVKGDHVLLSKLSVDAVSSEDQLCKMLIDDWCSHSDDVLDSWAAVPEAVADYAPALRLLTFASCLDERHTLVAIFHRFDKIFDKMSGEILAVMRDLENDFRLACVNTSPLPYRILYSQRARREKGFTSEYGTTHPRISLNLISDEDAIEIWRRNGLDINSPLEKAYFDIGLEMSGRLPEAFVKATQLISGPDMLIDNVQWYRKELIEQIPGCFARLMKYLWTNNEPDVIQSITALHTGLVDKKQVSMLRQHRWASIILSLSNGSLKLSCESIGRAAVTFLRENVGEKRTTYSPEELYRRREYSACVRVCNQYPQYEHTFLKKCARLGELLFTDSPQSLYFDQVSWKRVARSAKELAEFCKHEDDREYFEGWILIADAHLNRPTNNQKSIEEYLEKAVLRGASAIDEATVYLGIRILAVISDPSTTSAAHVSIPLAEELMRFYVALVLKKKTNGSAFSDLADNQFSDWWRPSEKFNRPSDKARLTTSQLAMLVAIGSKARGLGVFDSAEDFQRFLTKLDVRRNLPGHYVVSGNKEKHDRWMSQIRQIYNRLIADSRLAWSLDEISKMTSLPTDPPQAAI